MPILTNKWTLERHELMMCLQESEWESDDFNSVRPWHTFTPSQSIQKKHVILNSQRWVFVFGTQGDGERESKKECKKVSTWEKQVDEESKGPLNNPAAAMTDRSKTRSPIATPGLGSPPSLGLNTPYGKFSKGKWFPEPTSTNDFAGPAITEKTQPHQPVSQHPKPKLPQKKTSKMGWEPHALPSARRILVSNNKNNKMGG